MYTYTSCMYSRHTKMNANWQPQSNLLEQVVSLLKAYLIPNNDIQRQSYERLQQFQQNLEFNLYLVHILSNQSSEFSPDIRQLAGLLLKRNIKSQNVAISTGKTSAQMEMLAYIRSQIICILADSNQSIRNTASSLVTTFVSQYTFIDEWPELMPALFQYLEQQDNVDAIAGAFSALCKICEDSASRLESSPTRPLNKLIPILLQYFHHPTSQFRQDALNCINHVLVFMPVGLVIHMEGFLQGISNLTQDANNQVRRLVCKSIVILLEVGVQYLAPHLDQIIQFILRANEDDDEEIAIEACEFWASFVDLKEFKDLKPILQPYLPRVLPLLFSKMVYSEEDLATFEAEEQQQNESVPDRPEDIKPIFHKTVKKADGQIESSLKPQSVEAQCTSETTFKGACGVTNVHVGDDSEDEDDEDDDDDDSMLQWNLRRCSAASLDNLANGYGNQVLPVLLPLLQERLSLDGPWPLVESGILALGAIADGCYTGITPHLPQLFPFLMQKLNDPAPFIRSITCWTLSRYASWIVDQSNHDQFLKPLMEGMLQRILDPHKKVQEAACSAFCTLEEEAREDLIPYLGFILQTFMCAFAKYQAKNLLILYDAIGTLADSVSSHLNEKEFIAVLMPPLLSKWNELADNNREILPLFECLASVASALGNGFEEFALIVYGRCQRIVENELMADAMYEQNPTDCDAGDPEFLVCALDLISGIVEGIQCQCEGLLMGSNILNILANCIQHSTLDVRQSAMGVIGDIAKYAPAILKPGLEQMIPILVHNIDPEIPTVCNNASWSVGEIAMQLRGDMEPFVHDILTRLIGMINRPKLPRNLIENCAITIGRLGYVCPHQVAPYLKEFAKPWCRALAHLNSMEEKEECFLGLCYVIQANPNGIVADFVYFCGAIASLQGQEIENQELKQMLYQLVHSFKQSMGENWANYFAAFPKSLQTFLSTCFHI